MSGEAPSVTLANAGNFTKPRTLCETRLPVQHIASLAGFGTAEQMRLRFHARHGHSPAAFRRAGGLT